MFWYASGQDGNCLHSIFVRWGFQDTQGPLVIYLFWYKRLVDTDTMYKQTICVLWLQEHERLYDTSYKVTTKTFQHPDRYVPVWVRFVTKFLKNLFWVTKCLCQVQIYWESFARYLMKEEIIIRGKEMNQLKFVDCF